ncbi:unnamed protein product [Tuber melanosporum]|jgi:hypothetical protein|uniref:(Perigord truffle) hypothetical protein n=1 Tax=Tuber melanosporum (strain Mel28) TaxID=656061 RepID=D5GF56_TUBMM|nr:uncharacterized protein GSTUM_00001863001 [Tuber melanosporum]CAZ83149.1 unnamed protein product [Tuber melanosporum]
MKITHVKIREVLFILFLFFPPGKTFQQIYVSTIHGRVRMSQTGLGIVRQMSGRVYCEFPSVGSIPFFFFSPGFHGPWLHSFQVFILILLLLTSYWNMFSFAFMCQLLIYDVNGWLVDFVALMVGMI